MRAGRLRHRVTIQAQVDTQDEYGEELQNWNDVVTVWASVEPLRGSERVESKGELGLLDTRIVMRYRSGISSDMRAVFGERVFDIDSVINPYERKKEMQLMCVERVYGEE